MAVSPRVEKSAEHGRRSGRPISDVVGAIILGVLAAIALAALVFPTIVVVAMSFDSASYLRFPPEAFSLVRYTEMFRSRGLMDALLFSLRVGAIVVGVDLLVGIPAAIALVRGKFRGRAFLIGFLQSPMMVPGIVVGIGLLFFASSLSAYVPAQPLIVSHVVVTMPFVIRMVLARMESADEALEDAARNLRANRWQVFRHVVLPHLMPGIIGGAALGFLFSFDNLAVSIFTVPAFEPTLPVYIFQAMFYRIDPVISAIASVEIGFVLILIVVAARAGGALQIAGGHE